MSKFYKLLAVLIFIFPCALYAMNVGDYFQQAVTVANYTSQKVLVTDPAAPELQNYSLDSGYALEDKFASDQFTNPAGQTFIHTVTINSGVDYSVICVVQSNLFISTSTIQQNKPSSSSARCSTSVYMKSGSGGMIYGFRINVN
jgi:hypothetical protein